MPELEESDSKSIIDQQYQMSHQSRCHAEAALSHPTFRNWLTKPASTELLIHGAADADEEGSGVSLLAETLFQALGTRERYIRLAFFADSIQK